MSKIDDYIMQQIQEVDVTELVRSEIRSAIGDNVRKQISEIVKNEIDMIIRREIDIALTKPVTTDDGWGKINKYPSFDALFKQTFAEKMNSSWEVKREIERAIKQKVDDLFQKSYSETVAKIVTELTKGKQ